MTSDVLTMARGRTLRFVVSAYVSSALVGMLWARLVCATTIVGLIDNPHHRIVLAADGLVMTRSAKPGHERACKISVIGDCAFTMHGLVFARSRAKTSLDVPALARSACAGSGNLQQRADTFLRIAHDPVASAARFMREREPAVFSQIRNRDMFDVFFAGTSNGQLMILSRGFRVSTDGTIWSEKDESRSQPGLPAIGVILAGSRKHIVAYLQNHPDWANRIDIVLAVKAFLQLEVDANPEAVGPPISILEIDQGKICWIARGECKSDKCEDCRTENRSARSHELSRAGPAVHGRAP